MVRELENKYQQVINDNFNLEEIELMKIFFNTKNKIEILEDNKEEFISTLDISLNKVFIPLATLLSVIIGLIITKDNSIGYIVMFIVYLILSLGVIGYSLHKESKQKEAYEKKINSKKKILDY